MVVTQGGGGGGPLIKKASATALERKSTILREENTSTRKPNKMGEGTRIFGLFRKNSTREDYLKGIKVKAFEEGG